MPWVQSSASSNDMSADSVPFTPTNMGDAWPQLSARSRLSATTRDKGSTAPCALWSHSLAGETALLLPTASAWASVGQPVIFLAYSYAKQIERHHKTPWLLS